jgi:hypothetical protein
MHLVAVPLGDASVRLTGADNFLQVQVALQDMGLMDARSITTHTAFRLVSLKQYPILPIYWVAHPLPCLGPIPAYLLAL